MASESHRSFRLIEFVLLPYSDILKIFKEIIKGIEMCHSHLILANA
jgi:serine/threonine protein kinase